MVVRQRGHGMLRPGWRMFGIPLVTRISNHWSGSQIHKEFLKLLHPFLRMNGDVTDDYGSIENTDNEVTGMEASPTCSDDNLSSDDESGVRSFMSTGFEFQLTDERGQMKGCKIKSKEPLHVYPASKRLHVLVRWSKEMMRQYDTSLLMSLPLVLKPGFLAKKPHEVVSLYKCLEAFLKEEPLGPEDMWYCPGCKKHRQASKKLDLWRLPEILVIHLKRFSYSRFLKNKLETYVDFPIDKLDLSRFIAHKDDQSMNCYRLYAIINHYGGIGSGHYVALVYHGQRWYEFNDSSVYPASEDNIKTSVAYVLFYRRISET